MKAKILISVGVVLIAVAIVASAQVIPEITDRYSLGGWPNCAVLNGDYAYLAQSFHIAILDISGAEMQKIGEFDLPNEPNLLFIRDNYLLAFYQWSDSSLQLFDMSDPFKPVPLKRYALTSDWPQKVSLSGNYAFHASNDTLSIIDLTDPGNAQIVTSLPVEGLVSARAKDNLLLAGTADSLIIYDITDIENPVEKSKTATPKISAIDIIDHLAILGLEEYPDIGVKLVNIENPENPQELSFVATAVKEENTTYFKNPIDIIVENNLAYISAYGSTNLFVVDLSDPGHVAIKGSFEFDKGEFPMPETMHLDYPYIYLCQTNSSAALLRIDVSDPANPILSAAFEAPKSVRYAATLNDTLFVASDERLWIYHLEDPQTPRLLGSSWQWSGVDRLEAGNGHLYAARGDTLFILDYSDVQNITARGHYHSPNGTVRVVSVRGEQAYLLTVNEAQSAFEVVNVADPANPSQISQYPIESEGRDLFIPEDNPAKAYVAFSKSPSENGLLILDLTSVVSINPLGTAPSRGVPSCLWVEDSLAFVGSNDDQFLWHLESFNVARPESPQPVASREGDGIIWDIQVVNELVAASIAGTIDEIPGMDSPIRWNLDAPKSMLNQKRAGIRGGEPQYQGQVAFFGMYDLSLLALALVYEGLLFWLMLFGLPGLLVLFILSGWGNLENLLYSASLGLLCLLFFMSPGNAVDKKIDNAQIQAFLLEQNYPNPFNPETTIEFTIEQAGRVKLTVYDVLGREVAVLVDENRSAGNFKVNFRAYGLPSGLYVYQLEQGGFAEQKQMLLLK